MRIGLVCPYDMGAPGGVQAQVRGLAAALIGLGHDVKVVAPGVVEEDLGRVRRIRANRSVAPIALGPGIGRKVKERLAHCDIVHVHEPLMPSVSLSALRSGRPTVATFHAAPAGGVRLLYKALGPVARRRLDHAVSTAVSRTAAEAAGILGIESTIVPNGVFVPSAVKDQADRHGVLFIGRDEPRKGLSALLAAWPLVQKVSPDSELTIVGVEGTDGPNLRFLGNVDEATKQRLLASSAVLCAPNLGGESFGVVVAEGMAGGCAVVCSDLPAFADVGGDGVATFPVGNVPALALLLASLLSDGERRSALAGRARERVRCYAWATVTEDYLRAYERALGS